MKNLDIREETKKAGVYLWEIAEYCGISEFTLTRKLRHELPDDQKRKLLQAITEISKRKEGKPCYE